MDILQKTQDVFSNREISTFFWIIIVIMYLLLNKSMRESFMGVLVSFFKWKIQATILFAFLFSIGIVYILFYINFWDSSLLKDSILWFIVSAFVILFNLNDTAKNKNHFKDIVIDNLKIIVVFEFIVNIHNFSLLVEFIFIPIMVFLVLIQAISESKDEYKIVFKFINGILSVIGLALLILSIIDIVNEFKTYASLDTLKSFFLPIILTLTFIPCAYLIALVMKYESLFIRVGFYVPDKKKRRYVKRRVFLKCTFSLSKINSMSPKINYLYTTATKSEIKEIIN